MSKNISILFPKWLITVNQNFDILQETAVVIVDGEISQILPAEEIPSHPELESAEKINLPDHILMPGLINCHTHAAMALMRGMADDLPLMDWLTNHIWPTEAKWVNHDFIRDGVSLAAAEMIRSGTTCFNDMYFFPEIAARTAQQLGIRSVVGLIVLDFPTAMAKNADEYLHLALSTIDEIKQMPLISAAFAPHAPYTVSDEPLEKIAMYSNELEMPVHMHIHETAFEVDEAVKNTGMRPLQRLDQLKLLNPNLLAVHMTQIDEFELERLAETGVNIAHCPESNMKLASGFCPVDLLHQNQINLCLGTDGAASNNDHDMFGEMRSAALLAKVHSQKADACDAENSIRMATINGARALGLADSIGSVEIGKRADLIAIDMAALNTQPLYDPAAQLVYAANSRQVSHVWIDGKCKLDKGQFTDLDQLQIISNAADWASKMSNQST